MQVCIDIEANSLDNPTKVWLIVCKDIETGEVHVFREPSDRPSVRDDFVAFIHRAQLIVGHNVLEYDYPCLASVLGVDTDQLHSRTLDTLILSRLFNYANPAALVGYSDAGSSSDHSSVGVGETKEFVSLKDLKSHSIEAYGRRFNIPKGKFNDWSKYSQEMEEYCIRDVDICLRIYNSFLPSISDARWASSIRTEHDFQQVVNSLHTNGFYFNSSKANKLLEKVTSELGTLDKDILDAFPPKLSAVREIHPKTTRYGTLNKGDFRFVASGDLSEYNGGPFTRCQWKEFNPASHRQVIDVLHKAGWNPIDKTQARIEADRSRKEITLDKQLHLDKYGWKVNENNLSTLPSGAPKGAKILAKRIMLESRRRTLTEWISLVQDDGRIHGRFHGIGAWTHRMAHQKPNTANIPNELDIAGKKKLLGKEMRSLWCAPKNRLLVGVDAEGIQLRIFAHYIDDKEFTDALVRGRKDDKTDPHSLNQRILGSVCRSRAAAKRFIYALLLGAGLWKLAQILECSEAECKEALDRLLERYTGWARLKDQDIPKDARRSYFIGLDGRKVSIPGQTLGERRHLAMSGYLQNGEAVVMKKATTYFFNKLPDNVKLVNFVHDEWQVECPNDVEIALSVARLLSDSLRITGDELKLRCPMAGSYWNDDLKDYTVGTNWSVTH